MEQSYDRSDDSVEPGAEWEGHEIVIDDPAGVARFRKLVTEEERDGRKVIVVKDDRLLSLLYDYDPDINEFDEYDAEDDDVEDEGDLILDAYLHARPWNGVDWADPDGITTRGNVIAGQLLPKFMRMIGDLAMTGCDDTDPESGLSRALAAQAFMVAAVNAGRIMTGMAYGDAHNHPAESDVWERAAAAIVGADTWEEALADKPMIGRFEDAYRRFDADGHADHLVRLPGQDYDVLLTDRDPSGFELMLHFDGEE